MINIAILARNQNEFATFIRDIRPDRFTKQYGVKGDTGYLYIREPIQLQGLKIDGFIELGGFRYLTMRVRQELKEHLAARMDR